MRTDAAFAGAIDWLIRQRDPAFAGWESFTAWLESDPTHADAYAQVAAADRDFDALTRPTRAPVATPRRRLPLRLAGGALAAGVAALIGYLAIPAGRDLYAVETAPGQRRTIALEPGTQVVVNGGTRLILDHADPRYASLTRGQALFVVRHDPARPFRVEAATHALVDAGTSFEVTRDPGRLRLAVAEGLVIVDPGAGAVRVPAGRTLGLRDGEARAALDRIAPADVAGWREDRLRYDGVALAEVAADLARNLGVTVRAAPGVAGQPFRGVLLLRPTLRDDLRALAPVLDVGVERSGEGWLFTGRR